MTKKPVCGTLSTKRHSDNITVPKIPNVAERAKELLALKRIRFTKHANERMKERSVILSEVAQAITNGKHTPKKDRFSEKNQSWAYSIEGHTIDKRLLRIGISFVCNLPAKDLLLIITVIDLEND